MESNTQIFTNIDLFIFVLSLVIVMFVGFFVGKKEGETSEDYFLAGHSIPWWELWYFKI